MRSVRFEPLPLVTVTGVLSSISMPTSRPLLYENGWPLYVPSTWTLTLLKLAPAPTTTSREGPNVFVRDATTADGDLPVMDKLSEWAFAPTASLQAPATTARPRNTAAR